MSDTITEWPRVAAALGLERLRLDNAADVDAALAALAAIRDDPTEMRAAIAAYRAETAELNAQAGELKAELEIVERENLAAAIDAAIELAYRDHKLHRRPGDAPDPRERYLRALGEDGGIEVLHEELRSLPAIHRGRGLA